MCWDLLVEDAGRGRGLVCSICCTFAFACGMRMLLMGRGWYDAGSGRMRMQRLYAAMRFTSGAHASMRFCLSAYFFPCVQWLR